jgi:hypothetical protein
LIPALLSKKSQKRKAKEAGMRKPKQRHRKGAS